MDLGTYAIVFGRLCGLVLGLLVVIFTLILNVSLDVF